MAEPTSITKLAFELNDGTAFEVGALPGKLDTALKLEHNLVPVIQLSRFPVAGKQRIDLAIKGEIEQMVVAADGRTPTMTRLLQRIHTLEGVLRDIANGKVGDIYEDYAAQVQDMAVNALKAGRNG